MVSLRVDVIVTAGTLATLTAKGATTTIPIAMASSRYAAATNLYNAANPELVINLKTAKALGVTIPQPLLQRADQILE